MSFWISKPPAGTAINRAAASGMGLTGAWLFNEMSGAGVANAVSRRSELMTGARRLGSFIDFRDTGTASYVTSTMPPIGRGGQLSIVARINIANNSNVGVTPFIGHFDTIATANFHFGINVAAAFATTKPTINFSNGSSLSGEILCAVTADCRLKWRTVGVTFDGANVRFYIDGVLVDTQANTIIPQVVSQVFLGNDFSSTVNFSGWVDYIYLFDRALPPVEMQRLYTDTYRLMANPEHRYFRVATQYTQFLTATSTVSASIIKQINKPLSATSTGTASCVKSTGKRLSATATGTASVVRSVGKVLSATVTGTASIVKAISKTLVATVVGTAAVNVVNLLKRVIRIIKGGRGDRVVKGGGSDDVTKGGGVG